MANQRREGVSYRPFRGQANLAEGLLGVSREGGGELERGIAAGMARLSGYFGQKADQQTQDEFAAKSRRDLMAQGPGSASITGGEGGTASVNGQAGHVPGAQGGRVTPKQSNARAAEARSYLMQKHGFSAAQANAFVGHGMQESGFNTQALGDNGSAFGIMQWRGDRQTGLRRFAADSGRAADDLAVQLDWAVNELKTTERSSGEKFFGANDVRSAVTALMSYERPAGWTPENPAAGHGFANRLAFALGQPAGGETYRAMPATEAQPSQITPVDRPVEVSPGKAGTWRPMAGNSIAAKAYNEEGISRYKEMLAQTMLDDQEAIYEAYKDDPAKLEKAYGELLQAHRKDHVFEEIDLDYTLAFQKRANVKVRQATEERAALRKAEDFSAFKGRLEEFENTKSRMLAGLDPSSEAAEADLAALQGTIDQQYDSAVVQGIVTADAAEEAKRRGKSDLMTVFYVKQAAGKTPAEIQTMREEMSRDYADGGMAGVDAATWKKINDGFDATEREAKTQGDLASKALRQRGNDLVERQIRGLPVDAGEVTQFQLDVGSAPDGREIGASTMMRLQLADAIRTQPIGKVREGLWQIMTAGGVSPTPDDYDAAVKMVNAHEADIKSDPMAVAERYGIIPRQPALPDPLQATPDEMAHALSARIVYADAAASHFGVPPVILRPEEKASIKSGVLAENPDRFRASMSQLDILAGKLGLPEVERMFDKGAVDRLQDWQGRLRYASPDEAQKWLSERNSPQWDERVRPLVSKGMTEARKTDAADVVDMLDTNRFWDASAPLDDTTSRAMLSDFERLAGERYATTNDMDTAKEQAIERMQKVWGVTGIYGDRGGRLMLYPPEQQYPSVAGSTSWIADELKDVAQQRGIDMQMLALVSDGKTKAAIDRGEPPGYLLTEVDPESGLEQIVTDERGRPLRHYFDPKAAQAKAMEAAKTARETRNDPWLVLGKGSAIGPLYPFGADPGDLADRQRRIDATLQERGGMVERKKAIREQLREADIPGLPVPPEQQ